VIDAVVNASRATSTTLHFSYVWDQTGINPYVWPLAPNAATYFTQPPALAGKDDSYQINYDWASRESLDVPLAMQTSFAPTLDNLKARAVNAHTTQGGFTGLRDQGHISSFVHKDEFFWPRRVVTSGNASARVPVPNAGVDQTVAATTTATLDGSGSLVFNGRTLSYSWRQAEGPAATLASATSVQASFTVPNIAQGTALTFELRVSDGVSTSVADAVTIRVGAPPPPDAGTDAGTDAGVDAATGSDSGLDSGDGDGGQDASVQIETDAGAGALLDAEAEVDAASSSLDAASTDADVAPDADAGEDTSAWPGEEGWEQDMDPIVDADSGAGPKKNSGCALAADGAGEARHAGLLLLVLATFWRRRRTRSEA
jgi:MYXO-CTERM domain-containing protein